VEALAAPDFAVPQWRKIVANEANVKKAGKLAGGALGEKLAKFPLLFTLAAFFGRRPSRAKASNVRNGSVTLVDLGEGPLALTCQHVIACFRRIRKCTDKVVFQIGNVELDPLDQLIDENARLDLASIRLTHEQVNEITLEGGMGLCVFKPVSWPPQTLSEGDFVAFGGFPGELKTVRSFDELEFGSWSSGASKVCSVSDFQFVSLFERDYWVKSFGRQYHMDLRALGGMSGGPAFINRGLYWELVGIIFNYHENYDTVIFSSLSVLNTDGTIQPPPV
jgi:hypothetical protein